MDDNTYNNSDNPQEELVATRTKLLLRINAANLSRHGILQGLPDTYAVVTSVAGRPSRSGPEGGCVDGDRPNDGLTMLEWGRTEIIYKSSHPEWTTTFPLDYEYGSECFFYVQVFRFVSDHKDPVMLGSAVCEVGDILGSRNHTKVKRLPKKGGVESIFRFQFAASSLIIGRANYGMKAGPDTFFQLSKPHPNASLSRWVVVYRSSPVCESLDPTWDIGEIDLESCCNGDWDRPLRLGVVLLRKNAQDRVIAECKTTLRMILNTQRDFDENSFEFDISKNGFELQKDFYQKKKTSAGRLRVVLAQVIDTAKEGENSESLDVHRSLNELPIKAGDDGDTPDPYAVDIAKLPTPMAAPATFQDYVRDGILLDFCVAIDFTSSNGDPRIAGTLHDQNSDSMNDYEETISSIGNALAIYSDQFCVWGFGAKFGGVTRHIFQCGPEAQVHGVDGIMAAYRSVFQSDLIMSGPTLFHDVLKAAAVRARKHQEVGSPRRYCILLVITDGICQEIEETKRKLNVYGKVPLSVIFVGVGRSEFTKPMQRLCEPSGEGNRSVSTFVSFRQHQHDPASLGIAALSQVPSQVVDYMQSMGINPSRMR